MVDLGDRVEYHAEDLAHEPGGGFLERGDAVIRVAAILDAIHLAFQSLADERRGHVVVLTDAEVEELPLGMGGEGGAFGALDLLELVYLRVLAVVGSADAIREESLEPGVG